MATPTTLFELACDELGWGDPEGGLWFICIEESEPWDENAADKVREHFRVRYYFRPVESDSVNNAGRKGVAVRAYTAKIIAGIRHGTIAEWRAEQSRMWKPRSMVAQANLYPLARPNAQTWPEYYKDLFGFGASDFSQYQEAVEERRFPRFQEARKQYNPKAIVCVGSSHRAEFARALRVDEPKREVVPGKVYANEPEQILFVPFFSNRHMTDSLAQTISDKLRQWGVLLP